MADEMENEQQEEQQEEQQGERMFTQAEVDALISKRIAREKKGMPTEDELKAYRDWKKAQSPDDEGKATQSELDSALVEVEMARRENYLLRKGIDPEDVDYYVYRISKAMDGDTDFEDAAEEYLKQHKPRSSVRMDTGARFKNGNGKKTIYESQWEVVETVEVSQAADGDGSNSYVGGNYYNGATDSQDDAETDAEDGR